MRLDDRPVKEPVSGAELERWVPSLGASTPVQRAVVEGVLNTTPAPCLPCEAGERSLAACLRDGPVGCENLAGLARRAGRLAEAGASPGAIRAALRYAEPWTAEAHRPLRQTERDGQPVLAVELWIDPGLDPWREAVHRARTLQDRSAKDPHIGPLEIQIRVLPSGRHGDAPERRQAQLALLHAEERGVGLAFAGCLAEGEGMDSAALVRAFGCAGLDPLQPPATEAAEARRRADIEAAERIGLRSAPSWRVDGYRLRGHRELAALVDLIENQRLDHLADVPAPLLESWSAEPGSSPAGGPPR